MLEDVTMPPAEVAVAETVAPREKAEPSVPRESFFQRIRHFFSDSIGIDLGTSNTVIHISGRGIVLREPTVVALRGPDVVAIGAEAKRMLGKTPPSMRTVRPLRDGVIADFDVCQEMIRHFIRQVQPRQITAPRVVVAIPAGVTEVERRAVREAILQAGASTVYLIEECLAAAIGARTRVNEPCGTFVISIGGGTTQAAVISLREVVISRVTPVGGDALDRAIVDHFLRKHHFAISERTAENLKIEFGHVAASPTKSGARGVTSSSHEGAPKEKVPPAVASEPIEIKGRIENGLPRAMQVMPEEIADALEPSIRIVIETVKDALAATPPELAADVVRDGMLMAGGGALLRGLPERIARETGLAVRVAEDPLSVVAIGAGHYLENLSAPPNES
jgi:rod shape-determining protein MreB